MTGRRVPKALWFQELIQSFGLKPWQPAHPTLPLPSGGQLSVAPSLVVPEHMPGSPSDITQGRESGAVLGEARAGEKYATRRDGEFSQASQRRVFRGKLAWHGNLGYNLE